MRILIVTGIFYPETGGPAIYLYNLSLELTKRGYEVVVINETNVRFEYPFRVKQIPREIPLILRHILFFFNILWLGRRCDLLYGHGYGLPVVIANMILRKPMAFRVVGDFAWEHSVKRDYLTDSFDEFQKKRYPFRIELLRRIRDFYLGRVDSIIVGSS